MGKYITIVGSSFQSAPMSPARATLDQYLPHENVPSWEKIAAIEVALILHCFQVFLWWKEREIWDICILQSVLLTQRLLRPEGFMHQLQPSLMLALSHHLALGGFQHLGNMNMDQCSRSSSPSPCPCLGHALCLHLQLQGLQIPIKT